MILVKVSITETYCTLKRVSSDFFKVSSRLQGFLRVIFLFFIRLFSSYFFFLKRTLDLTSGARPNVLVNFYLDNEKKAFFCCFFRGISDS